MVREIKNKQLRLLLDKNGCSDIKLYKNGTEGYFYISSNERSFYDASFCIYSFNECTVEEWVKLILDRINEK